MPISPHIESTLSHIISPCSLQPVPLQLNRRNQNRGQEPSSSVNSTRCNSPRRLQPATPHAHGGASSQGLPSRATTEFRRGGGTSTNTAPTQPAACPLVQWGGKHLWDHSISSSLTPLNHRAGALLLLLILWQRKGLRGRRTLQRGMGVLILLTTRWW